MYFGKNKLYTMYSIRKNILFLQEDEVYAQALNKYLLWRKMHVLLL